MKKNCLPFFMLPFLCIFFCLSCIDKDYDTGDLNKTYLFGKNGFIFPIGDLEKYELGSYMNDHIDIDVDESTITYEYRVDDIFSEDFFDYFTYKFAEEKDSAVGSIKLDCVIFAGFVDPDTKPNLTIEAEVVNPDVPGDLDNWSLMDISNFKDVNAEDLKKGERLTLEMSKKDIVAMKDAKATGLRFLFYFTNLQKTQLNLSDYILLEDVKIISTGGIIIDP